MDLKKEEIKKILVVSLTNIGDVILTFPIIDILKRDFPQAKVSVIVGPKARALVEGNPHLDNVYIYNKRQPVRDTIQWILKLRKENFDLAVDLRNSAIPLLSGIRYKTSFWMKRFPDKHMRWQHLKRLRSIHSYEKESSQRYSIHVSEKDKQLVDEMLQSNIKKSQPIVVIAPGAADQNKRWTSKGFAQVCDIWMAEHQLTPVFVGDQNDAVFVKEILQQMKSPALDLSGKISLLQLADLFERCLFAFVNDSAPMHLASYGNVPVLALFGPTDPCKYGPWSDQCCVIQADHSCPACQKQEGAPPHNCMQAITVESVIKSIQIKTQGVIFNK